MVFKHYLQNSNNLQILNKLESPQNLLTRSVAESKYNYYPRMGGNLNTIQKSSKAYWSLLKRLANNKIKPLIPAIFCNNEVLTDFKSKAGQFNRFFAKQCFVIKNNSKLLSNFTYTIEKRLETIEFSSGDIDKIIEALDSEKVHSPDKINIGMLKICGNLIW